MSGKLTRTEGILVMILTAFVLFGIIHIGEFFIELADQDPPLETETGIKYRLLRIEGMDCIWYEKTSRETAGLSCNWGRE